MGLEQLNLETGLNKVDTAIELLKAWEPPEGYYLAFSGGKDSVAIHHLAQKANVKFDAHYCVSPIDPPQIRDFIKIYYPEVIWDYHAKGFWKIVDEKGLPTRLNRWCCDVIKESGGNGRIVIVGNRRAESRKRKNQSFISVRHEKNKHYTYVRPILEFNNYDIWQYINEYELPVCELYQLGFARIGCILCPYSSDIKRQELYFPKVVKLWKLACDRLVEQMKARNYLTKRGKPMKRKYSSGEELYQWFINRK